MSRIGRLPITVPAGVDVTLDGRVLTVKGPKGTLTRQLPPRMALEREGDTLTVTRPTETKMDKSLHGLTRTLVNNMVVGVTTGYRKGLEIVGVGYRAQKTGEKLVLALGYSHPVEIDPPDGISFELETPLRLVGGRASTRSSSARSRPASAPPASPSRTRARASGTPVRRSAARRARPARSAGRSNR